MKTRLFRLFSFLFLLFFAVPHAFGQGKVKLSGRVIDDEQNPVLFAVVRIEGQAAGTTTDLQGRYKLEFNTADTVVVSFSMLGYETKKRTLIKPRGDLRLNVTLQTQRIDMGEVTEFSEIEANFMQQPGPWIWFPVYVDISVSDDGKEFRNIKHIDTDVPRDSEGILIKNFGFSGKEKARYIRYFAHQQPLDGAYMFIDEIIIK